MSRPLLAAVVVVAALAGAGVGFYAWQAHDRAAADAASQAAAAPTAPEPAAGPPRKLVETVPDFQLADREGVPRSLARDWPGKSLVVNFWATWCAPCRREIPLLQKIERERAAQGVQVIGIAVDFRDKVLAYATDMKIDYPLLIGEQDALDAATAFGIDAVGFPFTIFTDAQGRIVLAHLGELHEPDTELILDQVNAVNTGRTDLAQARATIEAGMTASKAARDAKTPG